MLVRPLRSLASGGRRNRGSSGEPSYNAATDKLILSDGFESYASINSTAPKFTSRTN